MPSYSEKLSMPSQFTKPDDRFFFDPSHGSEIAIQMPLSNPPENLLRETPTPNLHHTWAAVSSPDSTKLKFNLLV